MVKPEQVIDVQEDRLVRIERYFDNQIKDGLFISGKLRIAMTRTDYTYDEYEKVLNKYRAVGWIVTGTGPWTFSKFSDDKK